MKVNLTKGQIIEINLGETESSIKVNNKVYTEKINGMDVAIVSNKHDKKFKDSFVRNIYQRCIGVGNDKYRMCLDYSFEV